MDIAPDDVTFIGQSGAQWRCWLNRPLAKRGGFGRVYEAVAHDGTPMAVKVVEKQRPSGRLDDRLLRREIDIGRRVVESGSDMLLPVIDAADADHALLLVMARADGALTDVPTPVSETEVMSVMADIATGLQQAHSAGIIHRDLKPDNVLHHDGHWKLADFGIARDQEIGTQHPTFTGYGSPPYLAPELWDLKSPTVWTDLYALGCIGYELLTGDPPFTGDRDAIEEGHRTRTPPDVPASNMSLKNLISRLLAKNPGDRPQDARAVLERLQRAAVSPPLALQRIAAGLDVHAQEKARIIAKQTAIKDAHEARLQLIERAKGDLREILSDALEELRIVEPEATLQEGHRQTTRFRLATADACIEIHLWYGRSQGGVEISYPQVPGDSMVIASYVLIANRRPMHSMKWPFYDQDHEYNNDGSLDYLQARFPTVFNAANVAYEEKDGRFRWQAYKFHRETDRDLPRYGPVGRTFGLYHGDFLSEYERERMLRPVRHVWTMMQAPLSPNLVLQLFQEAVDLQATK